jgi:hypothetical protein
MYVHDQLLPIRFLRDVCAYVKYEFHRINTPSNRWDWSIKYWKDIESVYGILRVPTENTTIISLSENTTFITVNDVTMKKASLLKRSLSAFFLSKLLIFVFLFIIIVVLLRYSKYSHIFIVNDI